jgi:DNA-binding NtrC family response regulator
MRDLRARIEQAARTRATVLVLGETGTGKELVARSIHERGPRRGRPFVVVDCAAIPRDLVESELFGHVKGAFTGATATVEGAFRTADGGTLFLDEIGELELSLQPKLLRALEAGVVKPVGATRPVRVDVRVVAASLRDLAREVAERRFRADLFYRLAVVRLDVPALRARREDVPLLVEHFLAGREIEPPTPDSLRRLCEHSWPGNVRELRNVLERAVALSGRGPLTIRDSDLEATWSGALDGRPYKDAKAAVVDAFTRDYLEALLARHQGNLSAASREAGVDRGWISALAARHGLRARR